jgi:hypothetical protein
MQENRTKVRVYRVTAFCDCGGEMQRTGQTFLTYPEKIQYICTKCNKLENSTRRYPHLDYEDDEGEET